MAGASELKCQRRARRPMPSLLVLPSSSLALLASV
jgi:hypothetical protein